ncbi:MAG: hypothetical protein ACFB02_13890 [Mastigocoleus sp.]
MEAKVYQEVDRFFPSSKTCHICLDEVGSLAMDARIWTCEQCKTKHEISMQLSTFETKDYEF